MARTLIGKILIFLCPIMCYNKQILAHAKGGPRSRVCTRKNPIFPFLLELQQMLIPPKIPPTPKKCQTISKIFPIKVLAISDNSDYFSFIQKKLITAPHQGGVPKFVILFYPHKYTHNKSAP